MNSIDTEIMVSVIVPVYNSEKYLRTCLDSLVTQNFSGYEIIAVNNGSTDNSLQILDEYVSKYPDIVFCYTIPHSEFVGTGRNYGLGKARGKYIYLCDSDDIVEKNALLFLYGRMKRYDLDVVYGTVEFVNMQSNTIFMLQSDGEREVSINELILSGAEFWRRMFKKSLLEEVGPMPENTKFDDIAWLPVVHSYAKKAMSTNRKIYNYFRRSVSTVGGTSRKVIEDTILSEKYAVEHCNPEYKNSVLKFVARRILSNIKSRWTYRDLLLEEINFFWEQFCEDPEIVFDGSLFKELEYYYKLSLELIPMNVYLADESNMDKAELQKKYSEKIFVEDHNFYVIDEKMIQENIAVLSPYTKFIEAAKDAKDYHLLKTFYAMLEIYEHGGIYIDSRITVNNVFNYLRCGGCFFSLIDKFTYSDWIFGGNKGNKVLKSILQTFEGNGYYRNILYPMEARIKNILTVLYEVPLNGQGYEIEGLLTVYTPDFLVANPYENDNSATVVNICEHDFTNLGDQYITVKRTSLNWMFRKNLRSVSPSNTVDSHPDYEFIKYRLESIEHSDAMRMALWLYKIGNKFSIPKKIVKKMLHRSDNKRIEEE